MQLARRLQLPALLCSVAVLLCELISHPYVSMGVCDDGPYILMARTLAATGHLAYNGWPAAMLGWQLYFGAAFIKLFGFSFTVVRMSTLVTSAALAFLLRQTFVAAQVSERNATIATLALVLSPLYLLLSVTFMSDIFGLFAVVACLYGCLRALQSSSDRETVGWLCFAIVTNALCGTARQIAWLGVLVMLPSTLWLLRLRRRVFVVGVGAASAGALFIFACLRWFSLQPYVQPEHLLPPAFRIGHTFTSVVQIFLELPFLVLPLVALFLPHILTRSRRSLWIIALVSVAYIGLTIHRGYLPLLEPAIGDWVTIFGFVHETGLNGVPPILLHTTFRVFLTIGSLGGMLGFALSFFEPAAAVRSEPPKLSWQKLCAVLGPFTIASTLFLIPRAASTGISDRYVLGLAVPVSLFLVRSYQDRLQPQIPLVCALLIAILAALGVIMTHNTFVVYRARVAAAAELMGAGIPDTSVDNGWEQNLDVELRYADHINFPTIVVPAHAYMPVAPPSAAPCTMFFYNYTPHIHPVYGLSFDPHACYGPAPFAPVQYSLWPAQTREALYVVGYTPSSSK